MMQHPRDIAVVAYYRLNGVNFGYSWRAGSTSIATLALNNNAEVLAEPPDECILLLKHPIDRFRSAYMILPEQERFEEPSEQKPHGEYYVGLPPIDDYINGVLDDVEGVRSPHCWPQMEQHAAVKELLVYRLEGSTHLAGVQLPHLNQAEGDKPLISDHPRYDELHDYYVEDLEAWNDARPLT